MNRDDGDIGYVDVTPSCENCVNGEINECPVRRGEDVRCVVLEDYHDWDDVCDMWEERV